MGCQPSTHPTLKAKDIDGSSHRQRPGDHNNKMMPGDFNALTGDIDIICPSSVTIVRIFTSSTFTDTKHERNMLMKLAYPAVKAHCRQIGYEFQVADMRWGVRDEATDDHIYTEICMKELKLCQEVSTGPNFVSLISHKYGYTPLPRVIEATEFEAIIADMEEEENKVLFKRWYTRDDNSIPAVYILSPISSRLPDFLSSDDEKKKAAKTIWWEESENMQNALEVTATRVFDKGTARKYIMSGTETEVTEGLLNSEDPSKHSLWFKRNIEDIEEQPSSYLLSRYIECTGPEEKWKKSREMLRELKEDRIAKKLSPDRIMNYSLLWNQASGINPDADKTHHDYLNKMCDDFVQTMTDMIDQAVEERARMDDPIVDECNQHIRFCQTKCEGFQGREDTLELIKNYVQGTSTYPLVLHGTSGTGKTSVMAMAAKKMKTWTSKPLTLVLRFLGTSPASSALLPLLDSLTSQIHRVYMLPPSPPGKGLVYKSEKELFGGAMMAVLNVGAQSCHSDDQHIFFGFASELVLIVRAARQRSCVQYNGPRVSKQSFIYTQCKKKRKNFILEIHHKENLFKDALSRGRPEKPLVLMLDSLDQLDPAYDARKLTWLLGNLAPGIKVIVSTLPEPKYDCFPALQKGISDEANFISVQVLDNKDVRAILESWLASRSRCLTDHQMTTVLDAFHKCPTPLFLKLSFEEAATWASFSPPDKAVLQDTVRASIDFLFQKLEKVHGQMLLSRTLSYLTIAINGATEAELEDILSCDDDVLNDVYMYWTPPIRRLPPLLLVRVKTDLNQYLVERGADGVRVIYWYHRQFIEAAEARYCSDAATNRLIHEQLADFFHGTWAGGKKKPYTNAKGESGEEDRHVSLQPLKFGDKNYNLRTLNNLPFHRVKAGQVALLKDQCLANPDFLIHKLEAVLFHSVVDEYVIAKQAFPEDELISEVLQTLQLSQKGLITDSKQLIPQLLQRLKETEHTCQLLHRCRDYPVPYIMPNKLALDRSGGQLVHTISAHNHDFYSLDITADGTLAVTACDFDKSVRVWDVVEAKLRRDVKDIGQCTKALFCNNDKWLACETDNSIVIQDIETGRNELVLPVTDDTENNCFGTFGKGRRYTMQFMEHVAVLTDLQDEKHNKLQPFLHPENMKFGKESLPTGSDNFIAVCDAYRLDISVYSLDTQTFRRKFRGFPTKLDYKVNDMAIMPDESCLAYTTYNNEVVFADFDGSMLRTIPSTCETAFLFTAYRSLNLTLDGRSMYIHDDQNIIYIFDTQTLQEVGRLKQNRYLTSVRSNDMVTVLTASDAGDLRIWDMSRPDNAKEQEPEQCATNLSNIREFHMLNNPRYTLLARESKKNTKDYGPHLTLEIYDNFRNITVTHVGMDNVFGVDIYSTSNDNQVIMHVGKQKIVRFDLQTMKIVKQYIGFTTVMTVAEKTEEVFCATQGAKHVKMYNKNGEIVKVIKVGQKQFIETVKVNTEGTVGCALTDKGPLLVYDITNRQHMYNIEMGRYCNLDDLCLSPSGTRMIFGSDGTVAGMPFMEEVNLMILWDVQARHEVTPLVDSEVQQEIMAGTWNERNKYTTKLLYLQMFDDKRAISVHCDPTIRVWNLRDGQLLTRMQGHACIADVFLSTSSPYIFSSGGLWDHNFLRVWDATTYTPIASFSLDKTVSDIFKWSHDGKFLMGLKYEDPPDLTMWKIHHGHEHFIVKETDYPETFKQNPAGFEIISMTRYDKGKIPAEEGDPDSDPENINSDDDDDNDDGDGGDGGASDDDAV